MKSYLFLAVLTIFISFSACKTIDIRSDYALQNDTETDREKGKRLLQETYTKMGYDHLATVENYEVNSVFKWKFFWSMMPMNALPGNKGKLLKFRFAANTFDGQVTYLEGRKKGKTYGLQSWETYLIDKDKPLKRTKDKRRNWGLATYHYLIEAPMRLLNADIIRYAGEREFDGKQYDLVYATWGEDAPHKEHDQWLVYINKETGLTDLTEVTINDFFLPVPNGMKGATIQTERQKAANGTYLPSFVTIQLGKPKKKKRHVYTFSLTDYVFDTTPTEKLYPLQEVGKIGDAKKPN